MPTINPIPPVRPVPGGTNPPGVEAFGGTKHKKHHDNWWERIRKHMDMRSSRSLHDVIVAAALTSGSGGGRVLRR